MTRTEERANSRPVACRLGVVVPTYREADNIGSLVADLLRVAPDAVIVVVDDSPDEATVAAVAPMCGPRVEVVHRKGKGGRGSAVLAGMARLLARDVEAILEIDADHSHPPSELPGLLEQARRQQLDLLIASRYLPDSRIENWPLTRRLFSRGANSLARTLLRVPVRDYTNGYRLYSRRAAELATTHSGPGVTGFIALSQILVIVHSCGMRIGERPTVFVNRTRGESSVTAREVLSAGVGLWQIFRQRKRLQREHS